MKHCSRLQLCKFVITLAVIVMTHGVVVYGETYFLPATADADVASAFPTTNDGYTSTMWIGYSASTGIMRSYVKFDVSQIPACEADNLQSATLKVYVSAAGCGTYAVLRAGGPWTEGGLTWNNQPSLGAFVNTNVLFSGGGYVSIPVGTTTIRSWLNGTLTDYGFVIKAQDEAANCIPHLYTRESTSPYRPESLIVVTNPSPPATPVPVATGGCGFIDVAWTAVGKATWYHVFRDGQFMWGTQNTSVRDNNPGTSLHCYTVSSWWDCGESSQSGCAYAQSRQVPSTPAAPIVEAGCGYIDLSWGTVAGATSYCVYRDGVQMTCQAGVTWRDGSPSTSQRCYRVSASNDCGASSQSASACGTASSIPSVPGAPSVAGGCGYIDVTWSAVAGAASYCVYRDGSQMTCQSGTSWRDYSPGTGQRCYRVSASNSCGTSAQSASSCAAAASTPPTPGLPSASAGCGYIDVAWSPVAGATGYCVYRDGLQVICQPTTNWRDVNPGPTSHCYSVASSNDCGSSPQSSTTCVMAPSVPSTPTTPLTTAGCNYITVTWSVVTGATSYCVYRDGIQMTCQNSTSWQDNSPGTIQHCYRIDASNPCGSSPQSPSSCAAALAPPAMPGAPLVTSGCGHIDVNWGSVSGAISYCVYRDGVQMTCLSGTSWRDSNPGSTQRCYSVTATNSCGSSSQSGTTCSTAQVVPPPPGPITAAPGCGFVDVSWSTVSGATSYCVFRDGVQMVCQSSTSCRDTNPGTSTHCYTVTASNGCGSSNQSTAVCGKALQLPSAPANLGAISECGYVDLAWDAVVGASSYVIYRDGIQMASGISTTWRDNSPGTAQRCYFVTAANQCGTSSPSNTACATPITQAQAPINLSPSDGTFGPMVVSFVWQPDASALSYQLQIDTSTSGNFVTLWKDSTVSRNSAQIAVPGGDLHWRVRANNKCGNGAWSTPQSYSDVSTDDNPVVPAAFGLFPCYPNPFNPTTEISYALPNGGEVQLKVYNSLGQLVAKLVDSYQPVGLHHVTWNAAQQGSGVYFYRLTAGEFTETKKMVLMK